ncbi:MAG: diaminopimelate epimerase [bacterium]|nr:diaminopimelate epimerase [bacterium]
MHLKGLPFIKVTGGGNDFILIDNRKGRVNIDDFPAIIPSICERGLSVGADGVILLTGAENADFNWAYFNSDGSEAPFCINGILSTARTCQLLGIKKNTVTFATPCGTIKTEIQKEKIRVFLPPPKDIRLNQELVIDDRSLNSNYVNTGVPHTVIFNESIDNIPVVEMGKRIRNHKFFSPDGTNVDFVQVLNNTELNIRTYERGVERETLSCGTGAFASAVVSTLLGLVSPSVRVNTQGGNYFMIDTSNNFLEGVARIIYVGELHEALWQK